MFNSLCLPSRGMVIWTEPQAVVYREYDACGFCLTKAIFFYILIVMNVVIHTLA